MGELAESTQVALPAKDVEVAELKKHAKGPEISDVPIMLGLGGHQLIVQVTKDMELGSIQQKVRAIASVAEDLDITLSGDGCVIDSVSTLLKLHLDGAVIFATLCKSVDALSWEELRAELTVDVAEFKGHSFTLAKLPVSSTPKVVADYLRDNQLLITSTQAQLLFDALLPTLIGNARSKVGSGSLRAQLIVALHSFCVDAHHIWEPNDGMSECLWANMTYRSLDPGPFTCRISTRGQMHNISTSSPAVDLGPGGLLTSLREVARLKRQGQDSPLDAVEFPEFYGGHWCQL